MNAPDALILRTWAKNEPSNPQAARRARIVLLSRDGLGPTAIADSLGCSKQTVITWRERFRARGIPGLRDAPRSGRPTTVSRSVIVTRTLDPPPQGAPRWTTRLLGAELGISNVAVASAWRNWGIRPTRDYGVLLDTDPVLGGPFSAVVGLHTGAPVRLIALHSAAATPGDPVPVQRRPDPGDLSLLATAAGPQSGRGDALSWFLDRLVKRTCLADGTTLRLVVDGAAEKLRCLASTRRGVAVHAVPSGLSWARLARTACLLAGASEQGAASAEELRVAVQNHRPGTGFTWLR